jgi:hypothetical protein
MRARTHAAAQARATDDWALRRSYASPSAAATPRGGTPAASLRGTPRGTPAATPLRGAPPSSGGAKRPREGAAAGTDAHASTPLEDARAPKQPAVRGSITDDLLNL